MDKQKKKKELPKFSEDIPTDFFGESTGGNVLLDSLNRGRRDIDELHEAQEKNTEAENDIPAEHRLTEKNTGEELTEQNDLTSGFIAFISDTKRRRDTTPVRILRENYDRIVRLREIAGGDRSVPELVDWILKMYLDIVDKEINQ